MSQIAESVDCDDRIKNIIHYLYMVQDVPLRDNRHRGGPYAQGLIKFMEQKHKFVRNKGQYERLFLKWGWKKNVSKQGWQVLKAIEEGRSKRGLKTAVYINKTLVPKTNLRKEISRQGHMTVQERIKDAGGLFRNSTYMVNEPFGFDIVNIPYESSPKEYLYLHDLPMFDMQKVFKQMNNIFQPAMTQQLVSRLWGNALIPANLQPRVKALLPAAALLKQQPTSINQVKSFGVESTSSDDTLTLVSYLLSNNLPGDARGETIYQWITREGGHEALKALRGLNSAASKACLENLFKLAIEAGDTVIVEHLLKGGINPKGIKHEHRTSMISPQFTLSSFQVALLHGSVQIARAMLQSGRVDVVVEEQDLGSSLLSLAIVGGHVGKQDSYWNSYEDWLQSQGKIQTADLSRRHEISSYIDVEELCSETSTESSLIPSPTTGRQALYLLIDELIQSGAKPNGSIAVTAQEAVDHGLPITRSPLATAATFLDIVILRKLLRNHKIRHSLVFEVSLALRDSVHHFAICGHRFRQYVQMDKKLQELNLDAIFNILFEAIKTTKYLSESGWWTNSTQGNFLSQAIMTGSVYLLDLLLSSGFVIDEYCLTRALSCHQLQSFYRLLEHAATDVTWEGICLLIKIPDALCSWLQRVKLRGTSDKTKQIAILAAIMYDSWLLMDVIKQWEPMIFTSIGDEVTFSEAISRCIRDGRFEILEQLVGHGLLLPRQIGPYLGPTLLDIVTLGNLETDFGLPTKESKLQDMHCLPLVQRLICMGADVNYEPEHPRAGLISTILVTALVENLESTAKALIDAGASTDGFGVVHYDDRTMVLTPLAAAVIANNKTMISYLVPNDYVAEAILRDTWSLDGLIAAFWADIQKGDFESFYRLLHNGADNTQQPGIAASDNDNIIISFWLSVLNGEADGESTNDGEADEKLRANLCRRPLLNIAIMHDKPQVVSLILQSGLINIDYIWNGESPIGTTLSQGHRGNAILRLLLEKGANPNLPAKSTFGDAVILLPLLIAAQFSDLAAIDLLLNFGAKPDTVVLVDGIPDGRFSLLRYTVSYGDTKLVTALLCHGANPDPPRPEYEDEHWEKLQDRLQHDDTLETLMSLAEETPLQIACDRGTQAVVEALIAHGAGVNAAIADYRGRTPLQTAAAHGYMGIVFLLLQNGADVNAPAGPSEFGWTALEGAAKHGRLDIVKMLLNAGARIFGEGQIQYERSLQFASENGHHALREMLEEYHRSGGQDGPIYI